jgi:hypothetical protein
MMTHDAHQTGSSTGFVEITKEHCNIGCHLSISGSIDQDVIAPSPRALADRKKLRIRLSADSWRLKVFIAFARLSEQSYYTQPFSLSVPELGLKRQLTRRCYLIRSSGFCLLRKACRPYLYLVANQRQMKMALNRSPPFKCVVNWKPVSILK